MNYIIRKHAGESAYLQLYHQLRQDIISGIWPRGAKLPSKRVMAEELGLSVITVEHALSLLCDEGYLESKPRSGMIVSFGGTVSPASVPKRPSLEDMRASRTAPDDFPFSLLAKTMRHVLSEYDRQILSSSPSSGCEELRSAIASWLGRSHAMNVSPGQIIIGSGSEYLYGLIVQLLGREKLYALENPSYETIRRAYEANGAQCAMLPMGEDGIDSSLLEACRADVLHVTPYHSYPSGVTATAAKRREYVAWAKRNSTVIVEDDYASEFAPLTSRIETVASLLPEQVIYLNTFSKLLASSFRTAFMVLPEPLLAEYRQKLDYTSCPVPVYNQLVLAEFLNEGHLERYTSRKRRKMQKK
ncbi:MAG: PLP-dependent aminotransferase family protein [Oscillospiraceae bacterium]|nr:PLP-dependent aminotransferase family protein [Oscillospiraceae bacterium]